MTNKEAIKELQEIKAAIDNVFTFSADRKRDALDLAAEALEYRPKGEWKPFVYDYDIVGDHTRPPKEGEEPHWEEYWAQEFKCSICGCKNHMSNYCPVCGADMRKEGEP